MGSKVWTAEEEEWLRREYPREIMPIVLDRFEAKFGRRPTLGAMWQKCYKLGIGKKPRDIPERAVRKVVWAREPEMDQWMREHDVGQSMPELSHEFKERFGFLLSRPQINLWRAKAGRQSRNSHGGGRPVKPIGSERICKDMVLVKTRMYPTKPQSKDNWEYKHYVEYRRAYGEIPEGCDVMACNHNRLDCRPENLLAVPHRLMALLNSPSAPEYHDRESLQAAVAKVSLERGIRIAERSMPRTCEVCGRTFTPDASRGNDTSLGQVRTCPECLAAGRKARGKPHRLIIKTCAVCGAEFQARQGNQTRCWGCISEKPKMGAKAQQAIRENAMKKKAKT